MHFNILLGGGQRSSEITRGKTLKPQDSKYAYFPFLACRCIISVERSYNFGSGQISFQVTGGQTLKTFYSVFLGYILFIFCK